MPVVVTQREDLNLSQLTAELGGVELASRPVDTGIEVEAFGDVTEQTLSSAIAAHVPDSLWRPDGPEKDWLVKLAAEISYIEDRLASWPPNATTQAEALALVNFLNGAVKRIARDLERVLRFIRTDEMDAGNGPMTRMMDYPPRRTP